MRRYVPFRVAITLTWSAVVWSALWAEITAANAFWGVVVGAATLWLLPLGTSGETVPIRPLAALRFAGFFLWALVRASTVVAWEVVTPRNRIHEGIVAAPLRTRSAGLITLIANAISLTPGTLTIDVQHEPPVLYVHVLHLRTIDETRAQIGHLEGLAMRAFPAVEPTIAPRSDP